MTKPVSTLERLFTRLSGWMPLAEFEQMLADYFSGTRTQAEIADYRAKRGRLKKIRDEVVPVLHHIKFVKAKGDIRFELNSGVPDCWLREAPTATPQGLEITVAQSREQHLLGKELNEKKFGRGYLGLPDDAPVKTFKERLARPRVMYSTEDALKVIGNGIKSCLTKKSDPRYAGHDLLVEAPLRSLPKERWSLIADDLRSAASVMPFREIHVIGNHDTEPFGFRIK
jgi:hypothetical protein